MEKEVDVRLHLQVHWPVGHWQEVPQLQVHPGPVGLLVVGRMGWLIGMGDGGWGMGDGRTHDERVVGFGGWFCMWARLYCW